MRTTRTTQTSLFDPPPVDHPVADDLERVSAWLDARPELAAEVEGDLGAKAGAARGRHGLSCETVLRCALLEHIRQESCRGLEFLLRDSLSAQRFARVDTARLPGKSALQATVGAAAAPRRGTKPPSLMRQAMVAVQWPVGSPSTGVRAVKVARSAGDVPAEHATLEPECIDRMYLNVYVPMLQSGAGTSHFFRKVRGNPVPSSALMEPMTRRFVAALRRFARDDGIDVVRFERFERKDDRTQEYLRSPEHADLRRAFAAWLDQMAGRMRPGEADWTPGRTLEEATMTLVERVAQWPEQWRREGVAEGRREGVAQERALLRRLAAVRFGDAVAAQVEDLLRTTEDWDRLAAAAELIVRAETGPGLIDGIDRSVRRAG